MAHGTAYIHAVNLLKKSFFPFGILLLFRGTITTLAVQGQGPDHRFCPVVFFCNLRDCEALGQICICRIWQFCHFRQMVVERCPNQAQSFCNWPLQKLLTLAHSTPIPVTIWDIFSWILLLFFLDHLYQAKLKRGRQTFPHQ
jgi:hypothetical protein